MEKREIKDYQKYYEKSLDKLLTIPKNHTALQYELRTFQYELTNFGKTKLFHLAKSSDDIIDALMMALNVVKQQESVFMSFCR